MSSSDWIAVEARNMFDGETESCVSVNTDNVTRIAAKLLQTGMPVAAVAAMVEIDLQEVEQIQHSLLVPPSGPAEKGLQCDEEYLAKLFAYPQEYVCPSTGKLMQDPVVNGEANLYLKRKIDAFRHNRIRDILSAVPRLAISGFQQETARLLGHAVDLAQGSESNTDLLKETFEVAVKLPDDVQHYRTKLVKLMVDLRQFGELVRRFNELDVSVASPVFSLDQASALFNEVRMAMEVTSSDELHDIRMASGRILLQKQEEMGDFPRVAANVIRIYPTAATWNKMLLKDPSDDEGADPVPERTKLLMELHAAEPAPDLHQKLAESVAASVPLGELESMLGHLCLPVLESVIEYAQKATPFPSKRMVTILIASAKRSGPLAARDLYRQALQKCENCAEARAGLIKLLLTELEAGGAVAATKSELAQLLIADQAFDTLAEHFEDIRLDVDTFESAFASSLADALAKRGKSVHAAKVAVVAATALENSGREKESMEAFLKAFQWDDSNQSAADGMKRLARQTGCELQVASHLLMAIAGKHARADRMTDAVNLLGLHIDKVVQMAVVVLQQDAKSKQDSIDILQRKVDALEERVGFASKVKLKQDMLYVHFEGFHKQALNTKFFCHHTCVVNNRETYWTEDEEWFLCFVNRSHSWMIHTAARYADLKAGCTNTCCWAYTTGEDLSASRCWNEFLDLKLQVAKNVRMTVFMPKAMEDRVG
mmetsp:Transcript_122871/g.392813  ORF Transcript_122871/g.392813 Transcript_122871/m.392813 type:complete len:714 (+) Transcript_122871:92-2233(+)